MNRKPIVKKRGAGRILPKGLVFLFSLLFFSSPAWLHATDYFLTSTPSAVLNSALNGCNSNTSASWKLSTTAGGSANTVTNSKYGGTVGQNNIVQFSPGVSGNVVCNTGTFPAPDQQGFITDASAMNGTTIPAGNWTFVTKTTDTSGKPGPARMHIRVYKTQVSGGNLSSPTLILEFEDSTQNLAPGSGTAQTLTFTGTAASSVTFTASDYLYVEYWLHLPSAPGGAPFMTFETNTSIEKITPPSGPSITTVDVTASSSGTAVANGVTAARQTDTIRINGSGFGATQGTSTVTVNGVSVTPSTWSDIQISGVAVPNGTNTGNIVVTVGSPSNNFAFTILPRITSFINNTEGGLTDGGRVAQSITFNGDHFGTTAGTVTIGSTAVPAGNITWDTTSGNFVTVTSVPNDAATNPSVVITRPADSNTNQTYSVFIYPRVTSIDVTASTSGTTVANGVTGARQTDTIRINGDHFGTAGSIAINGTANGGTPTWSATQITGVVVNGGTISGNVVITRTTPADNKTSGASSGTFTILPRITSVDITASSYQAAATNVSAARQTDTLQINGDHFGTPCSVTINGTASGGTLTCNSTSITSVVVNGGAISGNIVATVNGNNSNNQAFTLLPRIISLNPASGPVGTSVNINGDHFGADPGAANRCIAANNVKFNTTQALCADVTAWADTLITSKVPTGTTSGNVTVTSNNNVSNGVAFALGSNTLTAGAATAAPNSATSILASAPFTGDANQDSTTRFAIDTASGGAFTTAPCPNVTGASPRACSITGLTSGTAYYVKVTHSDPDGVNGVGTVSGTTISQVIGPFTPSTKILVAGQATAAAGSSTSITVTAPFTGDTGTGNVASTTSFDYSLSSNGPWTNSCASVTGASPHTCLVSGLEIGTFYFFRVVHTDSDGVGGVGTISGNTITQVIGSFNTLNNIDTLSISPNPFTPPATTNIQYSLANTAMLWFRIYNNSGSCLKNVAVPASSTAANKTAGALIDTWDGTQAAGGGTNLNCGAAAAGTVNDGDYPLHIDDTAFLASLTTGASQVKDVAVVQSNSKLAWAVTGASPNLFKSTDGSAFTGVTNAGWGTNLTGISVSSDGTKIYFIDKTNTRYWFSGDSGTTWSSSAGGLTLGAGLLNDIACNVDCTTLYMVENTKVYRSVNGGTSWAQLTLTDSASVTITPTQLTGVSSSFDASILALADKGANKVYQCAGDGTGCLTVAPVGTANGTVTAPTQLLVDSNFYLWVGDSGNNRIQEFDPTGKWIMTIGGTAAGAGNDQFSASASGTMGIGGFTAGSGLGQGYLYVADFGNNRILKYAYDNVSAGPITVNHPPPAPTFLTTCATATNCSQEETNGTTPIPIGAVTTEGSLNLIATVADYQNVDTVKLQLEVKPVGTAFACTNSSAVGDPCVTFDSGGPVTSGSTISILATGLANNTDFHWQARGVDAKGFAGDWASFGGNAETARDFKISNNAPNTPTVAACTVNSATNPGQYKNDGSSCITTGNTTGESKVRLRVTISDPDAAQSPLSSPETVKLQVEVVASTASFTNLSTVESALAVSGATAEVTVSGLNDGSYKWQARVVDRRGNASPWSAAPVDGTGASFKVLDSAPNPPTLTPCAANSATAPGQYKTDGSSCISLGTNNTIGSVILKGTISDSDSTDTVQLQVEVRLLTVAFNCATFTGSGSTCVQSSSMTSGLASVTITGLADGDYHWRARTIDDRGKTSAWVGYGGNSDGTPPTIPAEKDFGVAKNPPNLPTGLTQRDYTGAVLALAGTVTVGTVKLEGTVSDPDPANVVKLRVEICPNTTAFNPVGATTGCFTFDSPFSANNLATTLSNTIGALPNGAYHWRAKSVNNLTAESGWVNAAANASNISFTLSDTSAPNAITDLKVYVDASNIVVNPSANSVTLTWTAPGNNATPTQTCPNGVVSGVGTAGSYDIRYATKPIVNTGATAAQINFANATPFPSPPAPQAACAQEIVTVTGLDSNTAYYIAVKANDGSNGFSPISNVLNSTSHPFNLSLPAPNPPLPVTSLLTGLNLISVAIQPSPNDISSVLRDDVGDPIWTFRWLSSGTSNTSGCWQSSAGGATPCNTAISTIDGGKGYFLMFDPNLAPIGGSYLDAPGTLTSAAFPVSYSLPLNQGWNMIGNSYEKEALLSNLQIQQNASAPVSFAQAATNGWIANAIYRYEGGAYTSCSTANTCAWAPDQITTLRPWRGYWIQVIDTNAANSYQLIVPKP